MKKSERSFGFIKKIFLPRNNTSAISHDGPPIPTDNKINQPNYRHDSAVSLAIPTVSKTIEDLPGEIYLLIIENLIRSVLKDVTQSKQPSLSANAIGAATAQLNVLKKINKYWLSLIETHQQYIWLAIIASNYNKVFQGNKFTLHTIPYSSQIFYFIDKFRYFPASLLNNIKYEKFVDANFLVFELDKFKKDDIERYLSGLFVANLFYRFRDTNIRENKLVWAQLSALYDMLTSGNTKSPQILHLLYTNFNFLVSLLNNLIDLSLKEKVTPTAENMYSVCKAFCDEKIEPLLKNKVLNVETITKQLSPNEDVFQDAINILKSSAALSSLTIESQQALSSQDTTRPPTPTTQLNINPTFPSTPKQNTSQPELSS